jgi:NAD(P)-dependent dehydrogenase (short-subunit alcohol dehydrogenase family)
MAEAQTWFITGYVLSHHRDLIPTHAQATPFNRTSRGIGLQLVRQLIPSSSNIIIASCRDPTTADDLNALKSHSNAGNLHIIQLDVTDEQSIKAAAKSASEILGDKGLDYLVNNAGIVSLFPSG